MCDQRLNGPIIVFDAMCVLCSKNAQFVLRHDHRRTFRLAAMQSDFGAALYRRFGIDPFSPDTLIVTTSNGILRDSDAVLAVYSGLGLPWSLARVFRVIPRSARDLIYRAVARNRYRIFGKRTTCWLPDGANADRIL